MQEKKKTGKREHEEGIVCATTKKQRTMEEQTPDGGEDVKYNLSKEDRRLLAFFLGYLKSEEREAVKDPKQSCLFVFKTLFEKHEHEG